MSIRFGFKKEVFLFIVLFYQCAVANKIVFVWDPVNQNYTGGNNGAIVMENKDAIDETIVRHAVNTTPTYNAFSKESSTVANWNVLNPVKQTVSNSHHKISTEVGMNLHEVHHDIPTVSAPDIPPSIENILRRLFGLTSRAEKNGSFPTERDQYSISHISTDTLNDSSNGFQNYSDHDNQTIGADVHNTSTTLKDEQIQKDNPRYSVDVSKVSEIKGKQDSSIGTDESVSQVKQNEVVKAVVKNQLESTAVKNFQQMLERKPHVIPNIQTSTANMKPGHVVNRQTTRLPSADPLYRPRYPPTPQLPMYNYRYPIPMPFYHHRPNPSHTHYQGRFPVVQSQSNPLHTHYQDNSPVVHSQSNPLQIQYQDNSPVVQSQSNPLHTHYQDNSPVVQSQSNPLQIQYQDNSPVVQSQSNPLHTHYQDNSPVVQSQSNPSHTHYQDNPPVVQSQSNPLHTHYQGRFPVAMSQTNPLRAQYPGRFPFDQPLSNPLRAQYPGRFPVDQPLSNPLRAQYPGRFPVVQTQTKPLRAEYPGRFVMYPYVSDYPEYEDIFVHGPRVSRPLQSFSLINDVLESFT